MGRGSGALAATVVVSASSLAFGRVGDIDCSRFLSFIWSLCLVFEKSNKRLEQAASAALRRLLRRSVGPADAGRTVSRVVMRARLPGQKGCLTRCTRVHTL